MRGRAPVQIPFILNVLFKVQGTSSSTDFYVLSTLPGKSGGQAPVQISFILKVSCKEKEGKSPSTDSYHLEGMCKKDVKDKNSSAPKCSDLRGARGPRLTP